MAVGKILVPPTPYIESGFSPNAYSFFSLLVYTTDDSHPAAISAANLLASKKVIFTKELVSDPMNPSCDLSDSPIE